MRYGVDDAILQSMEDDIREAVIEGLVDPDQGAVAFGIMRETRQGGPLLAYIAEVRNMAVEAIRLLPELDPHDASAVMKVQQKIGLFTHALEWTHGHLAAAVGTDAVNDEANGPVDEDGMGDEYDD